MEFKKIVLETVKDWNEIDLLISYDPDNEGLREALVRCEEFLDKLLGDALRIRAKYQKIFHGVLHTAETHDPKCTGCVSCEEKGIDWAFQAAEDMSAKLKEWDDIIRIIDEKGDYEYHQS